ncbi:hypothetical protein CF335_g7499 [Tilletia laevis]|nr:hypothetical protein CF335_g7499 [Tilletia laevis]
MARRAVRFNLNSPDIEDSLDKEMDFYESDIARSADEGIGGEDIDDEQQTRADEQHRPSHIILDDDDEDAKSPPRVLSVQTSGGKIGCAFFDVTTGKLSLLEDAPEEGRRVHTHSMSVTDDADDDGDHGSGAGQREEAGDKFDMAKETLMTLLEQFAPVNLVLTSSDSSAKFHTAVRKELIYQDSVLSIRPSTEFATTSGMQRIHSLQLQEQKESTAEQQMATNLSAYTSASTQVSSAHTTTSFGNKLQSSCAVDLHVMPLSVGAAGALLSHLTRIQASFDHSDGYTSEVGGGGSSVESTLKITSIESIVLQDCLSISAESRIALDVFGEESHAALHSASRKHEGLSLFAILDSTRTPLSHSLLRRWLLLPTTDIAVIENRQAAISTFSSHRNTAAIQSITRELKGVKNIPVMVTKLLNGTARLLDWKAVLKFCYHALIIREAILDLSVEEPVEVVDKAKGMCDKKVLNFCSQNIAGIIDFDESASESRICIKTGYDEELDQWKQLYAGLPDLLNRIAQDIRPDVDPKFKEITVCYFPQLGYLLAIPVTEDMSDQLPTLDGWDFQFASENAMYFKGDKMRDLDTHLGDIHTFIVEREIEHLFALQEAICQHASVLLQIADLFAELDCLLALAEAATRFGWVCPEMTQENVIEIYQGRHALQELTVDSFVPNDAYLQGGIPFNQEGDDSAGIEQIQGAKSLLVVTGSNGSGKSIYLKQIALIVLLAHVGSFVPAEGARIGICDQILTSIQARHSVSRLQSSFLLDVSQVGFALRQCTPRSLVLFDEIGKGTDATGEHQQLRIAAS